VTHGSMSSVPWLSIVIPIFNEAERVADTIAAWTRETAGRGIACEILVYDDGSTDDTPRTLEDVARHHPTVRVTRHPNRGHGPTILRGYIEARGEWVLQIDGDDEVGTTPFAAFWDARDDFDLLIGQRTGRRLGPARRLLSRGAALAVRTWFGGALSDVNSPYRLMRRSVLVRLLPGISTDTFAPNVAITGLAIREGFRVGERAVASRPAARRRRASWSATRAAVLSLRQLLPIARRAGERLRKRASPISE